MMNDTEFGNDAGTTIDTKRKSRNQSEKRRRDAFNKLIVELTGIIGDGDKKLDKSNVLKQAIGYLKAQRTKAESTTQEGSSDDSGFKYLGSTGKEITRLYLEALDAGTFVLCYTGVLQFASASFAAIFGFQGMDMKGRSLFDCISTESAGELQQCMSAELLRAATPLHGSTMPEDTVYRFTVEIRDSVNTESESTGGRALLVGRFKRVACSPSELSVLAPVGMVVNPSVDVLCLVGVARPLHRRVQRQHFADDRQMAHRTHRHFSIVYNAQYSIVDADVRATQTTGWTRTELLGSTGYDFCHLDDLHTVVAQHKQLLQNGLVCQPIPFRLSTKAGHWLWVKCEATLDRDSVTDDPIMVHCVYTLVDRHVCTAHRLGRHSVAASSATPPMTMLSPVSVMDLSDSTPLKEQKRKSQPSAYIEQYPIPAKRLSPGPSTMAVGGTAVSIAASLDPMQRRVWEQLQHQREFLQQQVVQKQLELQQLLFQTSSMNSIPSPASQSHHSDHLFSPHSGSHA